MINEKERFFSLSGAVDIKGPSTWHITDWDLRRVISVTMDEEQDSEDVAIEFLGPLADEIPSNVYRIKLSTDGEILNSYTDPMDDYTYCMHYPELAECSFPEGITTIRRDQLEELDRLGPDADLVAYPPCSDPQANRAVFKYYWQWEYAHRSWMEMSLWMRLPRHMNLVPFDKVVVDELQNRVVGFTTTYIPHGNLEQNKSRLFKLKWLEQLIDLVDLLNLQYGIVHQDIAPRNLLVDDSADVIKLFDFNYAARVRPKEPVGVADGEYYNEDRNDVKGVVYTMYEIITQGNSLRDIPHHQQSLDALPATWTQHPETQLDYPLAAFRKMLQQWQDRRAGVKYDSHSFLEAIDWPPRPKPPKRTRLGVTLDGRQFEIIEDANMERRQDQLARGLQVLNWVRPSQRVLDEGGRLLSTGALLHC